MDRRRIGARVGRCLLALSLLTLIGLGLYVTLCWTLWKKDLERAAVPRDLEEYQLDKASQRLETCLAQWPDDVPLLLLAARRARLAGEFAEAESLLERCAALQPADESIDLESALLQAQHGNLAVEAFLRQRLSAKDPARLFIWEPLADGYRPT